MKLQHFPSNTYFCLTCQLPFCHSSINLSLILYGAVAESALEEGKKTIWWLDD
jgi:hypothetical protein